MNNARAKKLRKRQEQVAFTLRREEKTLRKAEKKDKKNQKRY